MKKGTCFLILLITISSITFSQTPNILLILADDVGLDYINGYHFNNASLVPVTPTLDSLRNTGITFDNAYATPKCTPSRSTIMSGKHGSKTGVMGSPGELQTTDKSIFTAIEEITNNAYADAVIGKWHISHPVDPFHPSNHDVDYFMGVMDALVSDYYAWERTENGVTTIDNNYVTSELTDASINWINNQSKPWFLWLAHIAPHGPFHVPPAGLFSIANTANSARKYVAAIEAMDTEIKRLLDNIPPNELQNTLIIFAGDNGTPSTLVQEYPSGYGKSTMYQGGIKVPMIISGTGVTRQGEREDAMIHITDIYATLLEVVGEDFSGGIYNSLSFNHLLTNSPGASRDYNFSEIFHQNEEVFAIRNSQYKLIENVTTGTQEFYDLLSDSLEYDDLMLGTLTASQEIIKLDLEAEADVRRNSWSCRDHIRNGDETGVDCGGTTQIQLKIKFRLALVKEVTPWS